MEGCQCGGGRVGDARGVKCGRDGGYRGVMRRKWRSSNVRWRYVTAMGRGFAGYRMVDNGGRSVAHGHCELKGRGHVDVVCSWC